MVDIDSKLRLAIIGVGGWGKNHARVLHDFGVLSAVCDMDAQRTKEIAERYNTNSYHSIDDLLNTEKLDACLVCTPTKTHSVVAKKIMERGINVFVEKPLSFSSRECEEMVEISQKKKLILTSGYIERFNPAVQDVKRLIDSKRYGDLLMMEFHRENRMPLHVKDVGIIYDTSVHDIDTAMFLFNSIPHVVFARAGKKFHMYEDFATIMLGFNDQRVAIIASNWITPQRVRRFSAVCTDGIIMGDFISQEIKIDHGEATIIPRRQQFQEPLTLELKNFLDAIEGKIRGPVVSAADATNVTKVAEAALLSNNTGSPVYLDLK
ncbi:MAG: Gfo/Idh/MocA family oxidoreductase [Nitrososphaeraceae archaeon]|nr:Gfo/Idh/MocA family oxidoreductase [Nitrososphaeraceae archaeon]MBV9668061.1 Gfo/Idh/MocA family oxidoreductase [Nitrososphaeraceae archaeon]